MTHLRGGRARTRPPRDETMTLAIRTRLRHAFPATLTGNSGIVLLASVTAVNITGFIFHIVVSRSVSTSDYGALGSLLGLLLVLSVPTAAIQVAITQAVAATAPLGKHEDEYILPVSVGPLLASAVVYGAGGFFLLLLATPLLKAFLHLPSLTPGVILAAYLLPAAIGLVPRAVLLGRLQFRPVAVAMASGALLRLVLGAFLARRFGLNGALAASVFGEIFTAALVLPAFGRLLSKSSGEPLRLEAFGALASGGALAGFSLLTTVDMLAARRYLPGATSGVYAASAVAARAAMFLPGAISLIAFPRFAAHRGSGPQAREALGRALFGVAVLGGAVFVATSLFPNTVMAVLFGPRFVGAPALLRVLTLSSAMLGLVSVLLHYHLAGRRYLTAGIPWAVVAAIAAGSTMAGSALGIAIVTLGAVAMATIVLAVLAYRPERVYERADLRHWDTSPAEVDLTIVVPYLNPGPRFLDHLSEIGQIVADAGITYEIVAVSDGSTDGSRDALEALARSEIRSIVFSANRGKGAALRAGLSAGRGKFLGFIDADGDIGAHDLGPALEAISSDEPDIVLGSKRHQGSRVDYPALRRTYSWGYQQLIRILFHLNVRDTQTGLKMVRRDVVAAALPKMLEKRFAFDLELLVVARHLGFRRFVEVPVTIHQRFGSTISSRAVVRMLLDTLGIFYRLWFVRSYDACERPPTYAGRGLEISG